MGGGTLAQAVLAGALTQTTTLAHRTDGQVGLQLQRGMHLRISGIASPRNGVPLAMRGVTLTAQVGDPLQTIMGLGGDKTQIRIREAKRL